MNRRAKVLLCLVTVALMAASAGVIHACFMRSPQPMQVWLDHIEVNITDQVAEKTYDCTFKNPNPQAVVGGTCYMELEPGAQVDDMSVLVDGKEMKAEILDVEKANQVFADMVKNGGSPALLEYYGNQLIQTKVPKVAPNSTVKVQLKYTTVLPKRGDLVRLQMLNTNPKSLMQPLKSASVTVNIKSKEPIKNIYSPTHEIKVVEKPDWDVAVEWSKEDYLPTHPFVLYYQVADDTVGASVIAHRELDEPGSFMLMLSPTMGSGTGQVSDSDILPKDVVFCVDTSGSMLQDKKMEQARAALKYCVENLRPGDRFNIVDFSTVARNFSDAGLVELTDETRAEALKYVDRLSARGGTAIQEALSKSLKELQESDRLKMILFATDGLPTIGVTKPEDILKNMSKENTNDVRVFVFGEGFDVNTRLLDFLALDHRGEADYILPEEDIQQRISRFFDRVGSPIMTDVEVEFEGLQARDVFPRKIPDMFKGEQVIVYGRYSGHGEKKIKVTGMVGGERRTLEYTLDFPEYTEDDRNSFVPRLWAGQKVDFLLNEIRKSDDMNNMNQELVDEVTLLAKRYGIVTPYTSFLMGENIVAAGTPQLGIALGGAVRKAAEADRFAPRSTVKQNRVADAKLENEFRRKALQKGNVANYYAQIDAQLQRMGRSNEVSLQQIRYIGSRTFYNQNNQWFDSVYDPEKIKNPRQVKIGSDEYLAMLRDNKGLAKYLALGDVVVQVKDEWVQFQK